MDRPLFGNDVSRKLIVTEQYGANHVLSKKEVLLIMVLLSSPGITDYRFGAFSLSKSRHLILSVHEPLRTVSPAIRRPADDDVPSFTVT